jgi:hypothetical protein
MSETRQMLPAEGDVQLETFSNLFERSSNLRDILSRLPGHLVLQSGLSAKRKELVDKWDQLESPGLDGYVSAGAMSQLQKWIHDAEISIAYVIHLGKEERDSGLDRAFAGNVDDDPEFELVDSIDELDFVSDKWCWPWDSKRAKKKISKSGLDKKNLLKYGAFAGLGILAIAAYMEDEEY